MVESQSTGNGQGNQKAFTALARVGTVAKVSTQEKMAIVAPVQRQTDVTFRRDANGRIYYVVSDAQGGQEISKAPKAVRTVDQGIEDYLKRAESKAAAHIEVEA